MTLPSFEAFSNRLAKNHRHLVKWARKNHLEAYRIYHRDIPEHPYIVDRYAQMVVVYCDGDDSVQEELTKICSQILDVPLQAVRVKVRARQKGSAQYEKIAEKKRFMPIKEGGFIFLVNVDDYLDCGLFLDHRPLRQKLFESSKNKRILNLFAYTGSLSVAAAKGGGSVVSVDMSSTYLNWAQENFRVNHLDLNNHEFVRKDILTLKGDEWEAFDIVVLDPPSFSNSKKMKDTLDIGRDHPELVRVAMKLLKQDGILYFSNNLKKFKLDASIEKKFLVKDVTQWSIPNDFRGRPHWCFQICQK